MGKERGDSVVSEQAKNIGEGRGKSAHRRQPVARGRPTLLSGLFILALSLGKGIAKNILKGRGKQRGRQKEKEGASHPDSNGEAVGRRKDNRKKSLPLRTG